MFALQPPPIVQAATKDDQADVIEVIGHRSDQALKIDRRTYEVRQTPHSKQKDTLQLLRGLPAITITPDDQIWYTDFARGYLGHFDPINHRSEEFASPSGPKSQPYGIVATKGALWYVESGAKPNTMVRFDPRSHAFQSWAIPGGGDIVRNMAVDHDGNPVMANSLVNMVGRVEIRK